MGTLVLGTMAGALPRGISTELRRCGNVIVPSVQACFLNAHNSNIFLSLTAPQRLIVYRIAVSVLLLMLPRASIREKTTDPSGHTASCGSSLRSNVGILPIDSACHKLSTSPPSSSLGQRCGSTSSALRSVSRSINRCASSSAAPTASAHLSVSLAPRQAMYWTTEVGVSMDRAGTTETELWSWTLCG